MDKKEPVIPKELAAEIAKATFEMQLEAAPPTVRQNYYYELIEYKHGKEKAEIYIRFIEHLNSHPGDIEGAIAKVNDTGVIDKGSVAYNTDRGN